ncbi:diaminobutyrate--2-oxoglutarate transaminase [Paenibacillus lutrae]|uniref:Diaminobutyrate--2-oxoglutarate transaminase n=1 Tax=Paenibacillus lutrae TaxID=2078573 RepID=A0A7X3JYA9_9BACL|nr:diaminobutyrate--2-oxoglutarate transaminase [Paenibacillus lutrae]MVO98792.1 diaminobutyrate--2-oxoglutarate transaminase [Paenibacillus lutrae]
MSIFEELESNVRSYCRSFPVVFDKAKDEYLYADNGREYLDFFAGAGALNYGHNNEFIKEKIIDYLKSDRIMHGLDMYTKAKEDFIQSFSSLILKPRELDYKLQFCGPTGTNAVEAALKLARKVTGRTGVFTFMGSFHGMSMGSLAVTSNKESRAGAGLPLGNATFFPYDGGPFAELDTIWYLEQVLRDTHSGIDTPAAIILETVQAEGGINVAGVEWLRRLRNLCTEHGILLIADDIQVGCGRTGPFFSFERAGITPDMVVLSKSISGYGLPMSLLLLKPELDQWAPGEHNGTFRGNQLAFVAAKAALEYRRESLLEEQVMHKEAYIRQFLEQQIMPLHPALTMRGIGLIWGIDMAGVPDPEAPRKIAKLCFENGLIIERAGRNDTVIKIMPPLMISPAALKEGCEIILAGMQTVLGTYNLVAN